MKRLTKNKEVSEMGMVELAMNSCYIGADGATRYRDFETDIDARDLTRKLMVAFGRWKCGDNELVDDDLFDETMIELLSNEPTTIDGLISLFYRNLWVMAELREKLKYYEELEEKGNTRKLEWIPCSERLPEDEEKVLVCTLLECKINDKIKRIYNITCAMYESGNPMCEDSDYSWDFDCRNVIAWMPLPEPYKEGLK